MATREAAQPVERGHEEWVAARGILVALTAATGAMLSVFALVAATIPVALVPASIVALGNRLRFPDAVLGGAGAAVWLLVAPHAHAEALVAPLAMALAWVALAIGPERLWGWVRAEWTGREPAVPATGIAPTDDASMDVARAWIEDDLSVR
jgi:hypothetical protein